MNGAASYGYDSVGNRKQKTSTIPGYPGVSTQYDADDRITMDTFDSNGYDNNGNTNGFNGVVYQYDFENHLISVGTGITMVYD
ncbi:MAG TPA: hypothetical protein VJN89_04615 [Candidatus Acidoferrum sp.]|nr:hypothetical protein [Candidatus Acidoferrum sp.]